MSATAAGLPVGLRRLWGQSLASVSLFAEALQLWPDGGPGDRIRQAELALLAGQPRRALHLLEHAQAVPGSHEQTCADLLSSCARALGGDLPAFAQFTREAVQLPPSIALSRLLALGAAACGQLPMAGAAAWHAMRDGCGDHRLLVIAAAAAAVDRRYTDAIVMAEEAERVRRPAVQDAAETTVNLLRHAGATDAAVALAAVGAQAWTLPAERRHTWASLAVGLLPPRLFPRHLLSRHLLETWGRGVHGLDPETSLLVRGHRRQRLRHLRVTAADVVLPLATALGVLQVGDLLMAGGIVASTGGLLIALVALPVVAVAGRRALARWMARRRAERSAERARRDLTCHCEGIVAWLGPEARHYVGHHLQPLPDKPPLSVPAQLLRCPATGATFLDLPERPATVQVAVSEPA